MGPYVPPRVTNDCESPVPNGSVTNNAVIPTVTRMQVQQLCHIKRLSTVVDRPGQRMQGTARQAGTGSECSCVECDHDDRTVGKDRPVPIMVGDAEARPARR